MVSEIDNVDGAIDPTSAANTGSGDAPLVTTSPDALALTCSLEKVVMIK